MVHQSPRSWKSLALVAVSAVLTVVAVDVASQRVAPLPVPIMELADGVAEYAAGDPDVLVLGSSHARTFLAVADMMEERSRGALDVQVVPVEWGSFNSYNWALQHRIRPLVEETDRRGARKRTRLRQALLITNYYDMCSAERTGFGKNLPARAWNAGDFLDDALRNGITDYNRVYLNGLFKRILSPLVLVQDRGLGHVRDGFAEHVTRSKVIPPDDVVREENAARLRGTMERDWEYCDDAAEKAALNEMLAFFRANGVRVTIVAFPFDPAIVTEKARETTLRRYSEYIASLADGERVTVADMTVGSPMEHADFQNDLDHVRPAQRRKFAAWALDNQLSPLLQILGEGRRASVSARDSTPRNN